MRVNIVQGNVTTPAIIVYQVSYIINLHLIIMKQVLFDVNTRQVFLITLLYIIIFIVMDYI